MVKVAGIQMRCSHDKEYNLRKSVRLAEVAVEKGARVICFQELFNTHWFPATCDPSNFALAEPVPGPTTDLLAAVAKANEVVLVCPIFEAADNGKHYNTAVVIDHQGGILGRYRKRHIPSLPHWQERFYFAPGDVGSPVFKTRYGVLAVQICWDNFHPELTRVLALQGVQIVFAPTACAFATHTRWEHLICGNAVANNLFIFRVNRVGRDDHLDFYGKSFCVDPEGELLFAPSGMNDGVVLAEVQLSQIEAVRKEWNYLGSRSLDEYRTFLGPASSSETGEPRQRPAP